FQVNAVEVAGERQRRPPLTRAGLGRQRLCALLLVEERLGHGRVRLVRADRTDALVLEVDVGRGVEGLFQPPGADEGRRPPQLVDLAHRLRYLDVTLRADLLQNEG